MQHINQSSSVTNSHIAQYGNLIAIVSTRRIKAISDRAIIFYFYGVMKDQLL